MPIDIISTAFDQIFEHGKEKGKRSEKVLKVLNAIGLKQDAPPADDFDGVYAYTLVIYGIDKPKPILDFFRHQYIKSAFRKSFEQRDESILEKEAENYLDWNATGKELIRLDYDPRQEFAAFREQFIIATNLSRTVHEILVDQRIDNISTTIEGFPTRDDLVKELAPLNEKIDEILETILRRSQAQPKKPFILPPHDISKFTGRERELEHLEELVLNSAGQTSNVIGITGMGGIGKTAFTIHFAYKYKDRFPDGVIFVHVGNNSIDTIVHQLTLYFDTPITAYMGLSATEIMQVLFKNRRILLIFDDVNDTNIRTLLYSIGNLCSVIVTTRNNGLLRSLVIPESSQINLYALSLVETTNLITSMVGPVENVSQVAAIQEIYELLGGLPLALQMAGIYVKTRGISLLDYVSKLRDEKYRLSILSEPTEPLNLRASIGHALKDLSESQRSLLANLGSLGEERLTILTAYKVSNQTEDEFFYDLDRLKRLSLVGSGENPLDITIHPLILDFAKNLAIERKDAVYVKDDPQYSQHINRKSNIRVFLCHSSYDKPKVRTIYQKLNAICLPWLDEEDIMPGEEWDPTIRKAVRESHIILVCLSKSSLTKDGYVQKEIRMALDLALEKPDNTIFIIPFKLEACEVPEKLLKWQYIDYFDNPKWFDKLRAVITRRAKELERLQ